MGDYQHPVNAHEIVRGGPVTTIQMVGRSCQEKLNIYIQTIRCIQIYVKKQHMDFLAADVHAGAVSAS